MFWLRWVKIQNAQNVLFNKNRLLSFTKTDIQWHWNCHWRADPRWLQLESTRLKQIFPLIIPVTVAPRLLISKYPLKLIKLYLTRQNRQCSNRTAPNKCEVGAKPCHSFKTFMTSIYSWLITRANFVLRRIVVGCGWCLSHPDRIDTLPWNSKLTTFLLAYIILIAGHFFKEISYFRSFSEDKKCYLVLASVTVLKVLSYFKFLFLPFSAVCIRFKSSIYIFVNHIQPWGKAKVFFRITLERLRFSQNIWEIFSCAFHSSLMYAVTMVTMKSKVTFAVLNIFIYSYHSKHSNVSF